MIHFTLYSRTYCHLCDDMLTALRALNDLAAFSITVVDVDADKKLVEKYDELVPVLVGSMDGRPDEELCHYLLDENAVYAFIASERDR